MRKLLIILATFLMVLVLAGAASAYPEEPGPNILGPADPDQVLTDNSAIDGHQMVYEYNASDTDHDIKKRDLATGTNSYVTSSTRDDRNPDISGNIVVWQSKDTAGLWQIYWKDTSSSTSPALVHASANNQFNPSISGNLVVWEEYYSAWDDDTGGWLPDNDIRGYDLSTNTYYNSIATSTQYEGSPDISGNTVVYQKYENIGTVTSPNWKWQVYKTIISSANAGNKIYGYDADQTNPAISGNNVVWAESTDSNGFNIWYHNLSSNIGKWVADDTVDEISPAISGNVAVWCVFNPVWSVYEIGWKYISNNNPETNPRLWVYDYLFEPGSYNHQRPAVSVDDHGIFISSSDYDAEVYWRNMDNVAPTIASSDPANNAINIPRNKVITITFSQPIKAGNMWIELKSNSGTIIPITKFVSGNVLTITHTALLAPGTKYNILLHTGSITDYAGNNIAAAVRSFTTSSDATAPTITSSDPANNAINVPRNKVITITFSEPIKAGTLWIELKSNSGTVIPATRSVSGNILTITHAALLAPGTKYNILLHTGSITDVAGNPLAAKVITFTTTNT